MFRDDIFTFMGTKLKYLLVVSLITLSPLMGVAQKVSITGLLSMPKATKIVFERLKGTNSWKVWKGADYKTNINTNGKFNLSFSIAESGYWKVSAGSKRLRLFLNVNQNVYVELDSNLSVTRILRQDLIDSPISFSF